MNDENISIFWFRQDLRISDNPALFEAAKGDKVFPIYILDNDANIGNASKVWLHHSLNKLNESLGNKLNVYIGNPKEVILKVLQETNIKKIYWNRCYEPWRIRKDQELEFFLKELKIKCNIYNCSLLWEPKEILKDDKTPYKVYTPFFRKARLKGPIPRHPLPIPEQLILLKDEKNSLKIDALKLLPNINWHDKIRQYWEFGEEAAQKKLQTFINNGLFGYKEGRNFPFKQHNSKLSPHLHFGEISPNQVWYSVLTASNINSCQSDANNFLNEIGWREFSYYLLYYFPNLPDKNFQTKFDNFPWESDHELLKKWQKGQTGYPIVDAGMRELWQTGYMHNRVRMIVGSFLIKNLLIHWHHGRDWFWDCLVDADLASNSASWQWVAGTGLDSAPYFRIFNPVTQGEKFDPDGEYTRHFVPELKKLPKKYLFKPWEAPQAVLDAAGVALGRTYPKPIIDLASSRNRALKAYHNLNN
jgi:deoxyribodipyrimidine photo-lyase